MTSERTVTKKRCRRCLVEKAASAFHLHGSNADGLQHWCKRCLLTQQKARRAAASVAKTEAKRTEILGRSTAGKACCNCALVKALDDYGKDSRKPDGRRSRCNACAEPGRRDAWARYRAKLAERPGGAE